jgi:hypothetical protein
MTGHINGLMGILFSYCQHPYQLRRRSGGEGGILSRRFPSSLSNTYTYAIISRVCAGCKQIPPLGTVSPVYLIPHSSQENGITGISRK